MVIWLVAVKSAKYYLYHTIQTTTLTFKKLSTVLAQIVSILNSQTSCYKPGFDKEVGVLTPEHFLVCAAMTEMPVTLKLYRP